MFQLQLSVPGLQNVHKSPLQRMKEQMLPHRILYEIMTFFWLISTFYTFILAQFSVYFFFFKRIVTLLFFFLVFTLLTDPFVLRVTLSLESFRACKRGLNVIFMLLLVKCRVDAQ